MLRTSARWWSPCLPTLCACSASLGMFLTCRCCRVGEKKKHFFYLLTFFFFFFFSAFYMSGTLLSKLLPPSHLILN